MWFWIFSVQYSKPSHSTYTYQVLSIFLARFPKMFVHRCWSRALPSPLLRLTCLSRNYQSTGLLRHAFYWKKRKQIRTRLQQNVYREILQGNFGWQDIYLEEERMFQSFCKWGHTLILLKLCLSYGEHTDYDGFTFLWRNATNGLQVAVFNNH